MTCSVILSTYNQPRALELAVWGYSMQTVSDFEIVVADDGSGSVTRDRIDQLRSATGLAIRHVWQQDDGFRKNTVLNKAILECSADLVLFSDGDCVPREDLVATHIGLARRGRYLSGGRVYLTRGVSDSISKEDVVAGSIFDPGWLQSYSALARPRDRAKLVRSKWAAATLDRITTTRPTWNGHNASAWRSDLVAVNGFDERLAYGGEDRELGERLRNHGLRPLQVRHRAVCVHLEHDRGYVDPAAVAWNERVRRETRGTPKSLTRFEGWVGGPKRTEFGIVKGQGPESMV